MSKESHLSIPSECVQSQQQHFQPCACSSVFKETCHRAPLWWTVSLKGHGWLTAYNGTIYFLAGLQHKMYPVQKSQCFYARCLMHSMKGVKPLSPSNGILNDLTTIFKWPWTQECQSQWLCHLRRTSVVACLLGLWVLNPAKGTDVCLL